MRRVVSLLRSFRLGGLALTVVSLLAAGASARDVIGRGDFDFYLDTAAFRGRDGRVLAEVSVRIPNNEIRFKKSDDGARASVKLTVLIADLEGTPVIQDAEKMEFHEADAERAASSLYFQTIIKRYQIPPGVYQLSYAVEDLESPKATLVGRVQGKNNTSVVRDIRLDLPEIPPDAPGFSQAKFLWDIGEDRNGRREYHPNPPRMYGLYRDTLMVYMELYLPDSLAAAPDFRFQSVITDRSGEELAVRDVRLPNPSAGVGETPDRPGAAFKAYPILVREDLNRLPAGSYALRVSFHLGDHVLSRVRAGNFSVVWDMRTWEVPRRELLAEARYLLGDERYEAFTKQARGEQEQMLDELWREADPTPETAVNEAYDAFLSRLAFVNAHYGDFGAAVFDPRGDLYMRLGPPDELVQDIIPLNRETASEAVRLVEDPYHTMSFSTHGVKLYNNTASRNVVADPRGLSAERAGDNVGYPFELWVYHASGEPILERDRTKEIDIGMRYLFVDRDGYGRYKLESSSSISRK